ncbi:MAG: hypothetical protein ACFFCI_12740 [Promethearchaeota archaeon]
MIYNQKEPPQEYLLRINGKIVPFKDLDTILDKKAGEISDLVLIFTNSLGLQLGEKSKFTFSGKGSKMMGKLVVQPIDKAIAIPVSSEIGEDVSSAEQTVTG